MFFTVNNVLLCNLDIKKGKKMAKCVPHGEVSLNHIFLVESYILLLLGLRKSFVISRFYCVHVNNKSSDNY